MAIEAGSHFSDEELFGNLNLVSTTGESRFKPHGEGSGKPTEVEVGRSMVVGAQQVEAHIDDILAQSKL